MRIEKKKKKKKERRDVSQILKESVKEVYWMLSIGVEEYSN